MANHIPEIITFFVGAVATAITTYLVERAKGYATKADVEEITTKVESIKTEFIRETEKLKGRLAFENQIKVNHNVDRKNAIINLYEKIHHWQNVLQDTYLSVYEIDIRTFSAKRVELMKLYSETAMAEARFNLYVNDDDANSILDKLRSPLLDFTAKVNQYIFEYGVLQQEREFIVESVKPEERLEIPLNPQVQIKINKIDEISQKQVDLFSSEKLNVDPLIDEINAQIAILRSYFSSLLLNEKVENDERVVLTIKVDKEVLDNSKP